MIFRGSFLRATALIASLAGCAGTDAGDGSASDSEAPLRRAASDRHRLQRRRRPVRHGWHDINEYLANGDRCHDFNCVTHLVLESLGGSWGGVEIWDTEVGVDQGSNSIPDDEQACGAAFLMRLTATSPRIKRLYYTRLHDGGGELLRGHTPRPALDVLAKRQTRVTGGPCK